MESVEYVLVVEVFVAQHELRDTL
jgi:hypothetical protein